jgi:hypothetical protein
VEVTSEVNGAFISERKALEQEDVYPTAEYRIFRTRESTEELIA